MASHVSFVPQAVQPLFSTRNSSLSPLQTLERRGRTKLVTSCCTPAPASLPLPWQNSTSLSQGLLTTSFETCTVIESDNPTPFHVRVAVDTAVTCTALQYRHAGQWIFCKPWGDEDGNIEACPLSHAPDSSAEFDIYVRAAGALASAVEGGEMLEVSEVMGKGFPEDATDAVASATEVWAFAAAESVFSLRPLLADVETGVRVRVFVVVTPSDVADFEEVYEIEEGDEMRSFGDASADLFESWVGSANMEISRVFVDPAENFGNLLSDCGVAGEGTVALLACGWGGLRAGLISRCELGQDRIFMNS